MGARHTNLIFYSDKIAFYIIIGKVHLSIRNRCSFPSVSRTYPKLSVRQRKGLFKSEKAPLKH
jgi:hypothetical protein